MIMITPLPGHHQHEARLRDAAVPRRLRRDPRRQRQARRDRRRPARADAARGRRCCAASTAIPSASSKQYWSRWNDGVYFTGDGARRDDDGFYWLLGRVDDVLNVAGPSARDDGGRERAGRSPEGRRGRGRRQAARDQGPGGGGVRHAQGRRQAVARRSPTSSRSTWSRRSARSRGPIRSSSPRICPRPVRARSCAGCCATSPKARRSATPRRWRIRPSSPRLEEDLRGQGRLIHGRQLRANRRRNSRRSSSEVGDHLQRRRRSTERYQIHVRSNPGSATG